MQTAEPFQEVIPLSTSELQDLRRDFVQSCLGLVVTAMIITGFTWIFVTNIQHTGLAENLFVWSPLILGGMMLLVILFHLFNLLRDIREATKERISGVIDKKYYRSTGRISGSLLTGLSGRSRHYIVVNGQRYLIQGSDYDHSEPGDNVQLYTTRFSKRVFDFTLRDKETDYEDFRRNLLSPFPKVKK